jgi:hypothetical protein
VADNIDGGGVQLAAVEAELDDGDFSSDAGYQDVDEGDAEVLSRQRRNDYNSTRNLMQRRVRARLN